MKILYALVCAVSFTAIFGSPVHSAPAAKVTAKVVDENGTPIQGADVTVGYTLAKKDGWGTDDYRERGKSDKDGLFTATGNTIIPQVTIHAESEGYYRSSKWAKFKTSTLSVRWEPWNPTIEVVLKKKRNPVPMYAKGTDNLIMPEFDKPIGFDLEKGDLVVPYGKGLISDFILTVQAVSRAYTDYECNFTLTFANEGDGIQEYYFDDKEQSYYRWPFMAPESGYSAKLYKEKSDSPKNGFKTNEKKDVHYIFRTRTKLDKDGKIVSAMYGKISQEFEFGQNGAILFRYYLNPDGTRNLEEDPKTNLLKQK